MVTQSVPSDTRRTLRVPSPAQMPLEELEQLAQHDFTAFKERFASLLPRFDEAESRVIRPQDHDPHDVAQMLRAAAVGLGDLGVSKPANNVYQGAWLQLRRDLSNATPDDALVIFKAMAKLLSQHSISDCIDLMQVAFENPQWGISAIKEMPEFFRLHLPASFYKAGNPPPANAFQALAKMIREDTPEAYKSTREIIDALKKSGVCDTPDPIDDATCLHIAAWQLPPFLFRAFVEEFPEAINSRNKRGLGPLCLAVSWPVVDNMKTLLDAGANPRLSDHTGTTLIEGAIEFGNYDGAIFLLSTEIYADEEVEKALSGTNNYPDHAREVSRVRAFYDALKAKQALENHSIHDPNLKPL